MFDRGVYIYVLWSMCVFLKTISERFYSLETTLPFTAPNEAVMVISMMPEQLDEEDTLHADEDPLQGPAVGMGVKSLEFQ